MEELCINYKQRATFSFHRISATPAISLGQTADCPAAPSRPTCRRSRCPSSSRGRRQANPKAQATPAATAEPAKAQKPKKAFLKNWLLFSFFWSWWPSFLVACPAVEGVNHSAAYRKRRVFNWLPLGMTYAFLYMGRYNIKVSQHAFGDKNLQGLDLDAGACSAEGATMAADFSVRL